MSDTLANDVGLELVRASAALVVEPILRLIQADPHQWSARPCQTCLAVTVLAGRDFGCVLYEKQRT